MTDEKFKNYKFKIEELSNSKILEIYHSIEVYSKKVDDEILLLSNGLGGFSLYLKDRFLNFNVDSKTKIVSSFEGDLMQSKIKITTLKFPTIIKNIILRLNTEDLLNQGMGCYIEFNANNILYDKEQKILQIGNINPNKITYKFFKNAYTQLEDEKIVGLIFTQLEII